jgi:hypothetical protein
VVGIAFLVWPMSFSTKLKVPSFFVSGSFDIHPSSGLYQLNKGEVVAHSSCCWRLIEVDLAWEDVGMFLCECGHDSTFMGLENWLFSPWAMWFRTFVDPYNLVRNGSIFLTINKIHNNSQHVAINNVIFTTSKQHQHIYNLQYPSSDYNKKKIDPYSIWNASTNLTSNKKTTLNSRVQDWRIGIDELEAWSRLMYQ